jgi:hypothetical protein
MFTAKLTRHQLSAAICLTLTLVTVALYWPMLHHGFIGSYDDDAYISDNPHVNPGLTWPGFRWAFQIGYAAYWQPLTWLSHMLDCQWYGLHPGGHHLTNLLFHAANTLLLFHWLKQLTGALWRSAIVAALFAWHPLRVESVAWAAERKDVLSAFFWMLTLIAYTRYAQRKVAGDRWPGTRTDTLLSRVARHTSLDYFLALLFFACGLMSKPMVVTLPFVLLLLDFWPLARMATDTWRVTRFRIPVPQLSTLNQLLLEKLPFFALALAGSVVTCLAQKGNPAVWPFAALPVSLRIANALVSYVRYLAKTFWPVDLALIYPYPHHWPAGLVIGAAGVLVFWTGLFLWHARRHPYLITGWLWFLGTLVPTIGLVQVGPQSMADRFTYLPGIGLSILLVWGLSDLLNRRPEWRQIVALTGSAALAGCLAVTSLQLGYWQNSLKVFLHAVDVTTDNYAAYNCLGNALEKTGRKEDALLLYRESVRVQPDFPSGQFNLGMLLLETGRPEEASNHLAIAAQLMPHNPDVQYDFGLLLRQYGKPQAAASRFKAALADRPDFPGALNDLAWILSTDPDPHLRSGPEAVRLAKRACELTQNQRAALLTTLSAACAEAGQFPAAIAAAQKARDLATAAGQNNIAEQDGELLKLYQAGKPYREPH